MRYYVYKCLLEILILNSENEKRVDVVILEQQREIII